MPGNWLRTGLLAGAFLSSGLLAGPASAQSGDDLLKMQDNPKNVVMPTDDYANHRYSALDQITTANVGKLQVAWTFSTGVLRGHEGQPLVIGDVMYVHTPFPNTVFALDLNHDGKILWKYEPKQDPNVIPVMCCDTVNRGVAYGDGKILLHQADTTLVALDAKTGKVVWSVKTDDPGEGCDRHRRADGGQGQGVCRRLRRRVRRARLARGLFAGRRQAGVARLFRRHRPGPAGRSAEDHDARQADRRGLQSQDAGRAISGRSAAAIPGAGIRTIRRPT